MNEMFIVENEEEDPFVNNGILFGCQGNQGPFADTCSQSNQGATSGLSLSLFFCQP